MNISVLGSGFIVNVFVEGVAKFPEYHLRGIWGRHREKIEGFKGFDFYTTDLDELLNDKECDVIYVALPNGLHYEYGMKALKAGKHVIMEKPFCAHYKDAKKMFDYAKKQNLMVIEAITTRYNPVYLKLKKEIGQLGEIKLIDGNFSQYSRRYDRFKNGEKLPVFDKKLAGGALLDLNVYNIHFVAGIFGMPKKVMYFPNMEKGVDTSGVLVLDYGSFKARLIAAKDCKANCHVTIQGDEGYLKVKTTASRCSAYELIRNDGNNIICDGEDSEFVAWNSELKKFVDIFEHGRTEEYDEYVAESLLTMKIIDKALESAKIVY